MGPLEDPRTTSPYYIAWLILSCIAASANAQTSTYSQLPPAAQYSAGAFTIPEGASTVLTEGSFLNITWDADFMPVNLWLIQGQNYNSPTGLALNYVKSWYYWRVNSGGDVSKPFSFRVVRANGTEQQQEGGGFESGGFWIDPSGTTVASASSSSSAAASPTSTKVVGNLKPAKTGGVRISHNDKTTSSTGLSEGAEVGIGLGSGIAFGLAVVAGICLFFWRRRPKRLQSIPVQRQHYAQPSDAYRSNHNSMQSYSNLPHNPGGYHEDAFAPSTKYDPYHRGPSPSFQYMQQPYEMDQMRTPVEVPGMQDPLEMAAIRDPQELHSESLLRPGTRVPPSIRPWNGRVSG